MTYYIFKPYVNLIIKTKFFLNFKIKIVFIIQKKIIYQDFTNDKIKIINYD